MQGYEVNALHYLMKPLDRDVLRKLITSDYERRFKHRFLIIKSGTQNLRIPLINIISFEIARRRVLITLVDHTVEYSGKLSELSEYIPSESFIRCHVSFIINLKNIRKLTPTEAIAVNGKIIPVSRAYTKEAQKAFLNQMKEI
jgi:DNA-binding LytR/AlgR family response regulator